MSLAHDGTHGPPRVLVHGPAGAGTSATLRTMAGVAAGSGLVVDLNGFLPAPSLRIRFHTEDAGEVEFFGLDPEDEEEELQEALMKAAALVLVLDSRAAAMEGNRRFLQGMEGRLAGAGRILRDMVVFFQYNFRDDPAAVELRLLDREINPGGASYVTTSAASGQGIRELMDRVAAALAIRGDLTPVVLPGGSRKAKGSSPSPPSSDPATESTDPQSGSFPSPGPRRLAGTITRSRQDATAVSSPTAEDLPPSPSGPSAPALPASKVQVGQWAKRVTSPARAHHGEASIPSELTVQSVPPAPPAPSIMESTRPARGGGEGPLPSAAPGVRQEQGAASLFPPVSAPHPLGRGGSPIPNPKSRASSFASNLPVASGAIPPRDTVSTVIHAIPDGFALAEVGTLEKRSRREIAVSLRLSHLGTREVRDILLVLDVRPKKEAGGHVRRRSFLATRSNLPWWMVLSGLILAGALGALVAHLNP